MSDKEVSEQDLLGYLDEMLPVERMSDIEKQLRLSEELRRRAASLAQRRDQGVHSVGEIWRRSRLSCPTREQLGSYLLGALAADHSSYVEFHLQTVGCRVCLANVNDLETAMKEVPETQQRRRRYFESSAGLLPRSET